MSDWQYDSLEDILTGQASARFKYLDVRSPSEWAAARLAHACTHIPLSELRDRVQQTFDQSADLVVFGADEGETAEAVRVLKDLGYRHVLAVDEGFPWWERRGFDITRGPRGEQ